MSFEAVTRRFGGLVAVRECTFSIGSGEIVGLVGPNGAGKSTLFNLASGYLHPSSGRVLIDGRSTTETNPYALSRDGISRTFQTPVFFPELTTIDNVLVAAPQPRPLISAVVGAWRRSHEADHNRAMSLLERVGLADQAAKTSSELSGGELRMLEVARQLFNEPSILLLDEPTAGVSPRLQDQLATLIRSVHADGVSVVVVEHNLGFLLDLVERVICLSNGSVIADGTPEAVQSDPEVIAAYLGPRQ